MQATRTTTSEASAAAAALPDDYSDTDDESYYASNTVPLTDSDAAANDIDPDAQIEALDEDIIFGTSNSVLLSENERAVKLTMQLIRESARTAAAIERSSDTEDELTAQVQQPTRARDEDAEIDALLQKKTLRLDWLNIGRIENLDAFTHVQELYLQHNLLRKIENLDDHRELTFLALGGNRIERVEGLRQLSNLKFLDLSNNCIEDFDIREFPESLLILRLAGNPFIRHMPSYVHLFFERLPKLVQVDQFRRAPADSSSSGDDTASVTTKAAVHATTSGTSSLVSTAVYSPRSHYVDLEMEVELSQNVLSLVSPSASASSAAHASDVDSEMDVLLEAFDLEAYEAQRAARLTKWHEQLQGVETRRAELGSNGSARGMASAAALHAKTLERTRAGTKAAIADSISHFQQMELAHRAWQETQQHVSPSS